MSDPVGAFFWGGVVSVLGFGLFVQRRRVLDTPTAKTLSAAIGRAELRGTAHGDPAEPSLVTGRPCAYWEAQLYRRVPDGKGGKRMKRIAQSCARVGHFWLEDDSGRLPVIVEGAQWWFDGASKFRSRKGDAISDRARAWVHAASGHDWSDGEFKLVEKRLEEGAPVYVLGTLSAVEDVLRPQGGAARRRPRNVAQAIAFGFLEMAFKPSSAGDGLSQAIARVRAADGAAELAQARHALPGWLLAGDKVAVWKGTRRDPFLIANCAENRLARLLMRWGFATMGLGAVLILSGVADLFK